MPARWNFRLGPIQFTKPVTTASVAGIAVLALCCCVPGIVMTVMEDSPDSPTPPSVVETSAPAATPTSTKAAATSSAPRVVTAGAFCDTAGQTGVTKGGTAMVCKGPGDLRWRRP